MNTELIQITDNLGSRLLDGMDMHQPECGSILLVGGEHGTAWQRMFDTGNWQSTRGGTPRSWNQLIRRRQVVLVYDAEPREDQL